MNNEEFKPVVEEEKSPEEETVLSTDVWPDSIDFDLYKSYLKDWKEEIIDSEAMNITDEGELMRLGALVDEAARKVLATVQEKGSKGREKGYLLKQLRALQAKSGVTPFAPPETQPTKSIITHESVVVDEGADVLASSGDQTESILSATSTEFTAPKRVAYSPELITQLELWKGSFLEEKRKENLSEKEIANMEKLADQASAALSADIQSVPDYTPSEADFLKKIAKFKKFFRNPSRTESTAVSPRMEVSEIQVSKIQEGNNEQKTLQEQLKAVESHVSTASNEEQQGELVNENDESVLFDNEEPSQPEPKSADKEPTAAIEAISQPETPTEMKDVEGELSEEDREALARDLNITSDAVAMHADIIREYQVNKNSDISEKAYNDAKRARNRLHNKMQELALDLGGTELFNTIKIPDAKALREYDRAVGKKLSREERREKEKTLPKETLDAYYDALRRKREFTGVLTGATVRLDVANILYREFSDHAQKLERLAGDIEAGNTEALKGGYVHHLLRWHSIEEKDPEAVIARIYALRESYNSTPPHEKRAYSAPLQSASAIETSEASTPPSGDESSTDEKKRGVGGTKILTEKKTKKETLEERVMSAVKEGYGDTVPLDTLRKFSHLPEVAQFLVDKNISLEPVEVVLPLEVPVTEETTNTTTPFEQEVVTEEKGEKQKGPSAVENILVSIHSGDADKISMDVLKKNAPRNPEIAEYYAKRLKDEESAVKENRKTEEEVSPAVPAVEEVFEIPAIVLTETPPISTPDASPGISGVSAVSEPETLGHNPNFEGNPEESVFEGLGALGNMSTLTDDEEGGSLIGKNITGEPEFVPKEDLQLDAQGEAMQYFIDQTEEVYPHKGDDDATPSNFTSAVPMEISGDQGELFAVSKPRDLFPEDDSLKFNNGEKVPEEVENVDEEESLLKGFDPEAELHNILNEPTAERKVLLKTYKEKLAAQKIGLAKVQAEMIEDIRKNPDMTKEEFAKLFGDRAEKYQATNEQRAIGSVIFEKFQAKHLAVEKVRSEHPDDAELFATLFGKAPKGAVEVIKGPMTLYFRCHDLEDYALIDSGKCLVENATITDSDLKEASMSNGKGRVGTLVPELSGVVLAENAEGRTFDGTAEQILIHEEQHAINWIIQRGVGEKIDYLANRDEVLSTIADLKEVNEKLQNAEGPERSLLQEEILRVKDKIKLLEGRRLRSLRRQDADSRAQDEIIAYTSEGRNLDSIYTTLTRTKADGGLYEYNNEEKIDGIRPWVENLPKEDSALIEELTADFNVQKKEIFETEYKTVLRSGLDAYQKLRDAGYKEEAIRGIFHDEPLTRWEKVVDRLVKEEKQVPEAVLEKYQAQFNISKETLRSIEGFRELSEGQQLLVLERMKSVAFDDINAQKVSRYRERIDELSQSNSWWDKIKGVGMKATKQFQLGRMKDEVSAEWLKGTDVDAAAMKKDALEGLVAQALQAKEFGIVEHEGKLDTVFISPEDFGDNIDPAIEPKISAFNEVANEYANKAFAENDEAGKAQLKQQYEAAARDMTHLLAEQTEGQWSGDKASAWRTKLEGAVQMSRFFQNNPEVDKELETAGKNIGSAVGFKNLLIERGTYSVGSAGARWLGVSTLGLVAAPVVAAIGGGVMGWRRAKQELSENDLLAAMGEKDKSDDSAHEKKPGSNRKDRAKNVVEGAVLVTKLENLLREYEAASETEMVETSLRHGGGRLVLHGPDVEDGKRVFTEEVSKKELLKRSLEARVAYTTRKMEERLVDLGDMPGDRAEGMSALVLALGKAQSELGFADEGANAVRTRLDSVLDIREEKIEANRKIHLVKQAVKGATMGAAFSGAGMLVGGMISGRGVGGFGGSGHSSGGHDIKAVEDAIRSGQGVSNLPEAITAPQQEALAKGFGEYMTAPDAAAKEAIAKTLGMTTGQIEAKINNILALSPGERIVENVPLNGETATLAYTIKAGDNLSHIMKAHLTIFNDLNPRQQENVIQNFIHNLSPQELKDIGITDVNHINIGQHVEIDRLNEILAAKRIGGQDLITHAQHLGAGTPSMSAAHEAVVDSVPVTAPHSEVFTPSGAGMREVVLSPLSPEATAQIESALGRSLSGPESHVLHSLQGLSSLTQSDAEQQNLAMALDHLQKEMQSSGGHPLGMAEMQRILHEHNGLDAQIKFPEAASLPTPLPHETLSGPMTYTQNQWEHLAESAKMPVAEHLAKDYLAEDTGRIFGKDVFGNPVKEWILLRGRSAQEVFGVHQEGVPVSDPSLLKIEEYVKTQGFTNENGYVPNEGETVEQFLRRVHTLRVLAGGPRPEKQ